MTVVGVTYQTILSRLVLQSCQLCDVAHDFRYDPRTVLRYSVVWWVSEQVRELKKPRAKSGAFCLGLIIWTTKKLAGKGAQKTVLDFSPQLFLRAFFYVIAWVLVARRLVCRSVRKKLGTAFFFFFFTKIGIPRFWLFLARVREFSIWNLRKIRSAALHSLSARRRTYWQADICVFTPLRCELVWKSLNFRKYKTNPNTLRFYVRRRWRLQGPPKRC